MATYIHGSTSEIQADSASGLQTLYIMTPDYLTATGYSETHYHALHHTQPHPHYHHQYINNNNNNNNNSGFLLLNDGHGSVPALPVVVGSTISEDLNRSSSSSSRFHYNTMWGPATDHHNNKSSTIPGAGTAGTHQGLSLSLSYREQAAGLSSTSTMDPAAGAVIISNGSTCREEYTSADNNNVMGSKYLKAAQQLLDEVVKVEESGGGGGGEKLERSTGHGEEGSGGGESTAGKQSGHDDELTTAQRQELQMKKAKLVNMLDEVERRYKEYEKQMQRVVSWFEQAAGMGSTKSYTALALQTISKQFRCLKDAIATQIKAAAGGLGREDYSGSAAEAAVGSRLKFVDVRQQRAALRDQHAHEHEQQHIINNIAWRPQRGLPESAVSVLRAWLFEHFLHPYPKDSDKHMLAKQTGLTRSQVSNWFINARVRLWKPMVEEMYLEEMKQQHHDQEMITSPPKLDTIQQTVPDSESKSIYSPQTKELVDHPARTPKKSKQLLELENINNNISIISSDIVGSFGAYNYEQHDQLAAGHGAGFHDFLSNQMFHNISTTGTGGIISMSSTAGVSPPLHLHYDSTISSMH